MSALRAPEVRRPARVSPRPATPARPRRPRLRAVPERAGRGKRWALILVAAVLVGGLLVATVATQALVNQTSFKMQKLQRQAKGLRQTNAQLTQRVADLSAPDRIVAAARGLGLGLPDSQTVQILKAGAGATKGQGRSHRASSRGPSAGSRGTRP